MSVKVVTSGSDPIKVSVETIPAIKVSAPEVSVISVNPNYTTGQPGAAGPQGPQGPAGNDGAGVPSGGDEYQVLRKGNGDNTEWAFADRVFIAARFSEAVSEGDPVYVSGFHGSDGPVIVSKADASDSSKMPAIGLATQDYSQNNEGDVACIGSLKDVDTDSFSVGDVLYVASGGGLTNTKPTGTNLIQNVGKVGRSNQNNGEIVVMAIGRSNDVPNIPDGQAWIGNSSGVATPTTLADVATSGAYSDLTGTPTINNNVTTDITISRGTDTVTVESSDGTDGIIEEATGSKAGVMTVAMHDKLDGIDANADVTDSTSVGNAGAVMDDDFGTEGLMKRGASPGSYSVVANTDGIDEGATNLFYTEDRFNTSLDGSTALRDADFGSAGMMKTDGAGNYSVITPGTGLAFDGNTVKVDDDTTLSVADNGSDVELKVTGPSGTESSAITFDAGTNITLTETGNNTITIASTASGGGGAEELNELNDVSITGGLATNDYLVYDGANFTDQSLDISHDADPDLGGNLDVGTHEIQSSSTNNLVLRADGTGKVSIIADDNDVELVATGASNYIKPKADIDLGGSSIITSSNDQDINLNPDGTGKVNLGNLPFKVNQTMATGLDNYVLTYDHNGGNGFISLEEASSGSGTVDVESGVTPSSGQVTFYHDADTITAHNDTFKYDETASNLLVSHIQAGEILVGHKFTAQSNDGSIGFGSQIATGLSTSPSSPAGGAVYYFAGTTWSLSNATTSQGSDGLLVVGTNERDPSRMLLKGLVKFAPAYLSLSSASAGDPLYLSTTNGQVSNVAPTGNGEIVRHIGYLIDENKRFVFFDPDKSFIEN